MSTQLANEIRATLLDVCKKMEIAHNQGVKIEFSIQTDQATGKSTLIFNALQKINLDN